jgi:hypothetical protein
VPMLGFSKAIKCIISSLKHNTNPFAFMAQKNSNDK